MSENFDGGPEYDYFDPTCGGMPKYIDGDIGWGTCPECGSGLENWGAVSQGDGDLYDELGCPLCQEPRGKANEIWLDDDDGWLDVEDTFESAVNQPPTLPDDIPF